MEKIKDYVKELEIRLLAAGEKLPAMREEFRQLKDGEKIIPLREDVQNELSKRGFSKPKDFVRSEIENRFMYHAPKEGQPEKYQVIRDKGKELAHMIDELCPDSREKSVAFTELETAIFWANAAIARN